MIKGLLTSLLIYSASASNASINTPPATVFTTYSYSLEDMMCLAKNIYFESRNQSTKGQIAVAYVTLNRVKDPRFPDSVCSVVTQAKKDRKGKPLKNKCQFSWYCDGKPDKMVELEEKQKAIEIAKNTLSGHYKDVTNGATHYHSTEVSPKWRKKFTKVAAIEDHVFYRWDSRKRK